MSQPAQADGTPGKLGRLRAWDIKWTLRIYRWFHGPSTSARGNEGEVPPGDAKAWRATDSARPGMVKGLLAFSQLGSVVFWGFLILGLYLPGVIVVFLTPPSPVHARAVRVVVVALTLYAGFLTAEFTVLPVKYLVKRPRPFQTLPGVQNRDFPLNTRTFSFPSGHCALWIVFGSLLAYACGSPPIIVLVLASLPLMALTRVALGAHYLADVLGGVACGAGVLGLTFLLLEYYFQFFYWVAGWFF